nr:reverse transcriptase domain-containing protein [Tanacetum cinerariifolium]
DTQGRQTEIFQRVEALVDDSQYHYETGRLVDQEAIVSRESWAHFIGLSSAIHFELQGYMTYTWVQDQRALTWWNSHVRIVGTDAACVMTWIELKKKMMDKYCLRNEMKKIETKLWNLEVQGTDLTRYNQHF